MIITDDSSSTSSGDTSLVQQVHQNSMLFAEIAITFKRKEPQPEQPSSLPSILSSIEPDQTLGPNSIPLPKQTRNIHIQRTIGLRIGKQLVNGRERLGDGVRRRPRRLEEIQTDFSSLLQ